MNQTDRHILLVLRALPPDVNDASLSQRRLACRMGVALGTANKLMRLLVSQGWIESSRSGGKVRYGLTRKGTREKLRLLKLHFRDHVDCYCQLRDRMGASLAGLGAGRGRVVFYGTGAAAEVAYVALLQAGGKLVGVVDTDRVGQHFLGHVVTPPSNLEEGHLNGNAYDAIVIPALSSASKVSSSLRHLNLRSIQVLHLFP